MFNGAYIVHVHPIMHECGLAIYSAVNNYYYYCEKIMVKWKHLLLIASQMLGVVVALCSGQLLIADCMMLIQIKFQLAILLSSQDGGGTELCLPGVSVSVVLAMWKRL